MNYFNRAKNLNYSVGSIFILTGLAVGMLITVQFKSAIPSTTFIYDELKAQNELIESYLNDQGLLKTKIISLREELDAAQERAKAYIEVNNLETLKALKADLGLETAKGAGVQITLNDGLFVDRQNTDTLARSLVNASDLRDMVNAIRTARPTAIAINDQRVVAMTPITSVGNTILVNNYHLSPPFTITVIGDKDSVLQRIGDTNLLPDILSRVDELKIQIKTDVREHLTIPVYTGNLSTKYINEKAI